MESEVYIEIESKVYIEIDNNNNIVKIFSSDFEQPTATSIEVDSGNGDKFKHAQSWYLPTVLFKENGDFNYKYVDKTIVKL